MAYLGPLSEIVDLDAEIAAYHEAEQQRINEKEPMIWHSFWRWIWLFSEWSGIGLGWFAPFVFERMIGQKGRKVKQDDSDAT